jgi:transcriptional regulator of acetoin/glycerol metabolism
MHLSWKQSLDALASVQPARYAIVESWARSATALHSRDGQPTFKQVDAADLAMRQHKSADLIAASQPRLQQLIAETSGRTAVAYVTDADGIVLLSVGDSAQISNFRLSPGYDWSEATMGTNGAGTALVARRPVAVVGAEHYLHAFENCTCTAAPVFGVRRRLLGAIDVSSCVEEAVPERLSDVIVAALEIEQELQLRAAAS